VSVAANAVAGDGQGADVAQTTLGDLSDSGGKDFVTVQVEELDGAGDVDGETATTECQRSRMAAKAGATVRIRSRPLRSAAARRSRTSEARCSGFR